jgi:hypothetical protein
METGDIMREAAETKAKNQASRILQINKKPSIFVSLDIVR